MEGDLNAMLQPPQEQSFGFTPPAQPVPTDMGSALAAPGQGPNISAPATSQEFEQRKSGWAAFRDRLTSDPGLQQTMLGIGLRMMQPIQPGQTPGGHVGAAVGDALKYHDEWSRKQAEEKRLQAQSESTIRTQNEGVTTSQQSRQFAAQRQPLAMSQLQNQVSTAQLELQQAQAVKRDQDAKFAAGLLGDADYYRLQAEHAKKLQAAELKLKDAQAALATSHGAAYDAVAATGSGGKNTKQVMNTKENPDGSLMYTYLINGKSYHEVVYAPMPAQQARQQAEKDVEAQYGIAGKSKPNFFSKAGESQAYKDAVAQRAQELVAGRVMRYDNDMKPVTALPEVATSGGTPGTAPTATTAPASGEKPAPPDDKGRLKILQQELQAKQAEPASPQREADIASLQKEIGMVQKKSGQTAPANPGVPIPTSAVIEAVRGPNGQMQRKDAPAPASTPTSTVPKLLDAPASAPIASQIQSRNKQGATAKAGREAQGHAKDTANAVRDLIKAGGYKMEDLPVIDEAISGGLLTGDELQTAKAMSAQIKAVQARGGNGGTQKTGK